MLSKKQITMRTVLNFLVIIVLFVMMFVLQDKGIIDKRYSDILALVGINVVLAVSLNLTTGVLGQLALGNAGFMSIGAYSAALFTKSVDWPLTLSLPVGLVIAGLVAAAFGIIIGIPALRLRGDYLAIITLAFGEIIRVLIINLDFTGGARGLKGISRLATMEKFSFVFAVAVITIFAILLLGYSRHGRAIQSIREDEIAAEASGIPTTYYKTVTFTLSAFFTGMAGALYAHHLGVLDAANFGFTKSVEIVVMVVLGGLGSITGSIASATVLTFLPEMLRGFAEYRMVVYSLALVLCMIFLPSGIFGRYEFSLYRAYRTVKERIRNKGGVPRKTSKGGRKT